MEEASLTKEKFIPFIDLKRVFSKLVGANSVVAEFEDGSVVAQHDAGDMFSARSVFSCDDQHYEDFESANCDTETPSATSINFSQSDGGDSGCSSFHLSQQSESFFQMLGEPSSDTTASFPKPCDWEIGELSHNKEQIETDTVNVLEAGPTVNIGSVEHGQRKCKPCLWHMKPNGCRQGLQCQFCHICGKDQYKLKMRHLRSRRACRISEEQSLKILSEVSKAAQPSKAVTAKSVFRSGSMFAVPENHTVSNNKIARPVRFKGA